MKKSVAYSVHFTFNGSMSISRDNGKTRIYPFRNKHREHRLWRACDHWALRNPNDPDRWDLICFDFGKPEIGYIEAVFTRKKTVPVLNLVKTEQLVIMASVICSLTDKGIGANAQPCNWDMSKEVVQMGFAEVSIIGGDKRLTITPQGRLFLETIRSMPG